MQTRNHPASTHGLASMILGQSGRAALCAVAIAAASLGGCSGHGKYTQKHLTVTKIKMNAMKAATEYDMAKQGYLAGDLKKALRHIDYAVQLNEKVPKSHVLRGRILLETGDLTACAVALNNARQLDATNVEARYYLGILAERVNKSEEALEHYQAAAEGEPASAQYALAATEVMIDLDRVDEAKEYIVSRRSNFEHNPGVHQILGHIAVSQEDPETAVACFQEARMLAPDDQTILEDLIHAQVDTGQFAQAEMNLARLLKADDFKARRDLRHLHASCLVQLDRPVDARTILFELTKDEAGSADFEAWIALGQVAYTLRDMPHLRLSAARAVAVAPDRPEGYVLRAMSLRRAGDLDGALKNLQAATEIEPSADTYVLMGLVQRDLNLISDARQSFAAAAELNPEDLIAGRLLTAIEEPAVAGAEESPE